MHPALEHSGVRLCAFIRIHMFLRIKSTWEIFTAYLKESQQRSSTAVIHHKTSVSQIQEVFNDKHSCSLLEIMSKDVSRGQT